LQTGQSIQREIFTPWRGFFITPFPAQVMHQCLITCLLALTGRALGRLAYRLVLALAVVLVLLAL